MEGSASSEKGNERLAVAEPTRRLDFLLNAALKPAASNQYSACAPTVYKHRGYRASRNPEGNLLKSWSASFCFGTFSSDAEGKKKRMSMSKSQIIIVAKMCHFVSP